MGGANSGTVGGTQLIKATNGGNLEVESSYKPLTGALATNSTGELRLEDTKAGGKGVECEFNAAGAIETLGLGKIESFTVQSCAKLLGGCESLGKITAVNLPWKTELYLSGSTILQKIVSGGSGTPEWAFSCSYALGEFKDTCGLNTSLQMINYSGGNVGAIFSGADPTTCAVGGKEAGKWLGTLTTNHPASVEGIKVHS